MASGRIPAFSWQARRESNPQPAVLETAALPIELLAYCFSKGHRCFLFPLLIKGGQYDLNHYYLHLLLAKILETLKTTRPKHPFECFGRVSSLYQNYSMILATTPAPTVRPPSRIAKRRPSSIAIGAINVTTMFTLSPGITISTPSGSSQAPVTSVVRK